MRTTVLELLKSFILPYHLRPEFGKCLNEEEQGELVRDEIEDMIKTMTNKNEEL